MLYSNILFMDCYGAALRAHAASGSARRDLATYLKSVCETALRDVEGASNCFPKVYRFRLPRLALRQSRLDTAVFGVSETLRGKMFRNSLGALQGQFDYLGAGAAKQSDSSAAAGLALQGSALGRT
jgi:hypothetical protein